MIAIGYKCACMKQEATFYVQTRGETEDIEVFMKRVQYGVTDAHQELSPLCISPRMEYVRIPVSETQGVGRP